MDWSKFNNLSILIIDDDQFTRELIETILKKIPNITIYQATDGVEALSIINIPIYTTPKTPSPINQQASFAYQEVLHG